MRHYISGQTLYRLFFAIKPGTVVAGQTSYFSESLGPAVHRVRADHLHVTLAVTADHLDYPYEVIKRLLRAGTSILADPFDLTLDRLRVSNRSAALCPSRSVLPLRALQQQIANAMGRAGVAVRPGWKFTPHQTLFYREGRPDQQRIDGFHWRVDEFVLICSHVGRTHHESVGRWPLTGDGQYKLL